MWAVWTFSPVNMAPHEFVQQSMDETFGAGLIGALVNAMMYGLTTLQTYLYFLYYPQDNKKIKSLVILIWVLDTVHTALVSLCIYFYLVTNYNNPSGLVTGHWSLFVSILCNVFIACIVQSYFTWKIYQLTKGRVRFWLSSIIGFMVFAHFGFGISTIVFCFIKKDFSRLHEFALISATPFAITAVLSDILIAGSLCVLLHGNRTGFRGTNALVTMLIIYAINRCLLTSVVAVIEVIVFSLNPDALWYLAIDFVIGKLYANSLLATLNSRKALAERSYINTTTSLPYTGDIEFEGPRRQSEGHILNLRSHGGVSDATNTATPSRTLPTYTGDYKIDPHDSESCGHSSTSIQFRKM